MMMVKLGITVNYNRPVAPFKPRMTTGFHTKPVAPVAIAGLKLKTFDAQLKKNYPVSKKANYIDCTDLVPSHHKRDA
jgi:hypothetical protein